MSVGSHNWKMIKAPCAKFSILNICALYGESSSHIHFWLVHILNCILIKYKELSIFSTKQQNNKERTYIMSMNMMLYSLNTALHLLVLCWEYYMAKSSIFIDYLLHYMSRWHLNRHWNGWWSTLRYHWHCHRSWKEWIKIPIINFFLPIQCL